MNYYKVTMFNNVKNEPAETLYRYIQKYYEF